ncbi:DoxX family protein [Actinomadura rugatobispora]|uniref:DoxX family protein n=1 Tax=Actinomadura rugatobispora TaxID=1994 RepID=A0ABW1A2B9_9ACTN|nr:hypothetical protein GCM10010200_039270 [Actinomadura rugatobispora]
MFVLTVIISVLTAAAFAFAGYSKVSGAEQQVAEADHLGVEWSAYRLIGVAELLGALGLLIGLWLSWLGVVAAFCLIGRIGGALIVHAKAGDQVDAMRPAIAYGVLAIVAFVFRLITA